MLNMIFGAVLLFSLSAHSQQPIRWGDVLTDREGNSTPVIKPKARESDAVGERTTLRNVVTPGAEPYNPLETPQQQMERFNKMKADGQGAISTAGSDEYSARCVPHRQPAAANEFVKGFKCSKIHPTSGFAKAGILEGDLIVKVDGKNVNSNEVAADLLGRVENSRYHEIIVMREGRESVLHSPLR